MDLMQKILNKSALVGVIGLGYVGLPLLLAFEKSGFRVTGFDTDPEKVRMLNAGRSYISHIPGEKIASALRRGRFQAADDFSLLGEVDATIICVPTPLNKQREPDLSFVLNTARVIARSLEKGRLVALESTTYPGTTNDEVRPILEATGLLAGQDFYLAFSPEREDPNNKDFSAVGIPKLVGGFSDECLSHAVALYGAVFEKTIPVSSTRIAEAAKLLENIYRAVNIALVNELKVLFDRMGIDIYEVIEAAKTKPFGFQPFYPGPGLGGHCIPIDPFYLTWKAREYDFHTRFIELAGEINTAMPYYVVEKVRDGLNRNGKSIRSSKVLVLGLAYKKDIDDTRESPSLKLIDLLTRDGADVDYNDPYIPQMQKTRQYDFRKRSVPLNEKTLEAYDCVIIATDHSVYDYDLIVEKSALVVDTRNAVKQAARKGNVIRA